MFDIKLVFALSLLSFAYSQQCIQGTNCPLNQGICNGNTCECLEGFQTFYNKNLPLDQQIYCNYQQINHFYPLILELFLPGIGHLYVGKYFFAIAKILLVIIFVSSSYYLYKELKIPDFITALKDTALNNILDELEIRGTSPAKFTIMQALFDITFYPFWAFWAFDLYMYFTKSYNDGNGIALV